MLPPLEDRGLMHVSLQTSISEGNSVAATLSLVFKNRVWEERIDQYGRIWRHGTFLEYLTAKHPAGLGRTIEDIRPLIATNTRVLAMFDEATQRKPGGGKNQHTGDECLVDNINEGKPTRWHLRPSRPSPSAQRPPRLAREGGRWSDEPARGGAGGGVSAEDAAD